VAVLRHLFLWLLSILSSPEAEVEVLQMLVVGEVLEDTGHRLRVNRLAVGLLLKPRWVFRLGVTLWRLEPVATGELLVMATELLAVTLCSPRLAQRVEVSVPAVQESRLVREGPVEVVVRTLRAVGGAEPQGKDLTVVTPPLAVTLVVVVVVQVRLVKTLFPVV
jgi:hypothetical protein